MNKTQNPPRETRKRKLAQSQSMTHQLTNYFASNLEVKSDDSGESKENEFHPSTRQKRVKVQKELTPSQTAANEQKITIFLRKNQDDFFSLASPVATEKIEKVEKTPTESTKKPVLAIQKPLSAKNTKGKAATSSQSTLTFYKAEKKEEAPRKPSPPKIPKKTTGDFQRKVCEIYDKEEYPIFKDLINKMNDDLKKRFNVKKIERLFHTSMKQFLRSSPDQLWDSVYKPINPSELMSDKYSNLVRFWIRKYFRDLKNRLMDSRENSTALSDITEESIGVNHPDFLKELQDLKFSVDEQDFLRTMKYKSLLLCGKEGRGKLSLIKSVCTELNLEIIEVCNSSNRSSSYLDQIYEATQSQNVFMNLDPKPNNSQESTAMSFQTNLTNNNAFFMPNSKASVIIIRDFDKPLEIDKGFQNKILKLAEISKSPFVLLCEKVPKKLRRTQDQGLMPTIDRMSFDKIALEDIALMFYIILNIEKNFSKVFKDFRYNAQSQCPEVPEDFEENFKKILGSIEPEQLELFTGFDDILEVTKYFEGNLTRLFSKIEFNKEMLYSKRITDFKKENFLAYESTYKKKHDIFVRFDKDYFSKQILDIHRGTSKKSSLQFNCELEHLTQVNKLTRGLDFFQEPQREIDPEPKSDTQMLIETETNSIDEVTKMADFLDRMGTLDVVETTILKNKLEPDWDYVGQLYGDNTETTRNKATDGQVVTIIPLKKDDTWNQFEIEEKTFGEIQKESLLSTEYLETVIHNPLDGRVPVVTSPYDEDLIWKMIYKLKKGICDIFSEVTEKNYKDIYSVNELLVVLGTSLNPDYQSENLKGRLRRAKGTPVNHQEKGKIQANIYLKSQLVRDLKEIRKDTKLNSKGITNNENPFSLATKDEDVNELIKILMTFSYAFFNKEKFSTYHTQVMSQCE